MTTAKRMASVQDLLPLEDIVGDVLCLRGGDYRAILEAHSINFALRSEGEQESIIVGFRSFLNALTYPLQVVVRILPTDVEVYLDGLRGRASSRGDETLRRLAFDHEAFVRRLARERALLERRFFVVIPAGLEGTFERSGLRFPWQGSRHKDLRRNLNAATEQLDFRCLEIAQALAAFGVSSHRLSGEGVGQLWSDFLRSEVGTLSGTFTAQRPVLTRTRKEQRHD